MKKPVSVLAASLIAGTIFTSSVSPASASSYADIEGTIYEEAVEFLMENYMTSGYPDRYGVEEPIKRVDAAVIMARYLELDLHTAPKTNFKDVPARATQAVAILKHHGIVYGKSDVYFGATDNITRGEAAVIFYRAFGTETLEGTSENSTSTKFTDVTGRYVEAVNFLVERGVIQGKSNNRFGTTEPLTRGQFALMIHRMHLYYDKKPMEFVSS
ncbi:S-layer homology domain-containing protein [Domibacillus sp. PGB-M46]|uniref:S-layer homology domain-containing protein n=1 Tax=Domibacillus sp. PGB-M46 TaxID=2910255 RepID=UPI001F569A7A|nr:S-layer homology domain-containing protein [Domibacillus sp. PGB-M46]MCI2255609.1 S-layer homology domain-containing protein [Domibacillus sp. PGB-M46]